MAAHHRIRFLAIVCALCLLVAAAAALPTGVARAVGDLAPLSNEQIKGELNGWGTWSMTGSLGGTFIHNTGQITAASDSVSEFKYFKDSNQWYGNGSAITFGQIYTNFSTSGGNSSFNHIQNKHYAFKWNGGGNAVLFQLSAAPVAIASVSQSPTSPTSSDPVIVTATTDATPPAEQALWLRYAVNNNWNGSTVAKMSGSGTSYAATIPAQAAGAQVSYSIFSSGNVASIAGGDADLMTITYNTNSGSNYSYTVASAPGPLTVTAAKAMWLDAATIAWNAATGSSYKLLYDADGGMTTAAEGTVCSFPSPAGPCYVTLTASGTISGYPKNPNATGKTRLLTNLSADNAKHLLRGQVVVASYDGGGVRQTATRVQTQSVLDALYAAAAKTQTLGVTYSGSVPSVKVWAPTAQAVTLRRYATSTGAEVGNHTMTLDAASGVWSVTGDSSWNRQFYLFDVAVYVYAASPAVDAVVHNLVTDPYAINLSADTVDAADPRSQFVNLADADLKPDGWDTLTKPALAAFEDISIYETHIRDFSINDSTVAEADRGSYLAFTYDGAGPDPNTALSNGMNHLLKLKAAGLTHVHLLPTFDIASVYETTVPRTVSPNPTGFPRDSQSQQAAVAATRATDGFNWGYDPYHYGAPEGSYSTAPDGVTRILQFRRMVSALNRNGLRVVMDVVYNHTASSGQSDHSVLDKVVPGYYYRYTADGALYTDSCCSDTASEYEMFEKLMQDTLVRWASDYKVDAFRFDLMNFHTRQNIANIRTALNAVDPKIYMYGEGWDFGSALAKGFTDCTSGWCYAGKWNMTGSGIGAFNDIIRDAAHGGYSSDDLAIRKQGFINGLSYDWNGYYYDGRERSDLIIATDKLRSALRGSGTDWNGQGTPFTDDPQEAINYVEKHDNETLFDQNVFKLPVGTNIADRVRSQNMGQSLIGLAQGIPFFQMGADILRSKSLDRNSYDSGDWFNRVDWTYTSNYFGSGLPPAWDNDSRWDIMGPLLTNTSLDPASANIQFAAAHFRELLRLRYSSPLFRLTSEADINARVTHYNTGNTQDALIVMRLSDEASTDLDANYENILVFFNANKMTQSITLDGANGFSLHPVHSDGVDDDPVVQGATFNDTTDVFTIPARTTVVFVSTQAMTPPASPSTLDWVGLLYPRGGVANPVNEKAFAPSGFDVYAQVYEAGWTETAGANSGIACFLHWGKYGGTFTDLAMTWNAQKGNNDEYRATLATLNALGPGTYGFTAYCQKTSETGVKWKQDSYDINGVGTDDDQGDGLITVIPAADPVPAPAGGVFVHLFEWRWADIEKECTYLADKGYSAVQVSPPNEHLVPTADQGGTSTNDYPWWVRYQPVTHDISKFTSRSGTWAEFQSMVSTCNGLGVAIYVDAVINHMAYEEVGTPPTGAGTAGTLYENGFGNPSARYYGAQYAAADFHTDCDISSYSDRAQVQTCKLSGLPDLNTGATATQAKIRAYLQALINAGVKGFRIDGAKHMAAQDIAAILTGLTGDFYLFQEVIDQSANEPIRDWEFTPTGDVTEFAYAFALGAAFDDACGGSLSDLQTRFSQSDMLPSRFAQVFTDNHDNQRGHGVGAGCVVDHRDGQEHVLANIFALAYPYGYPSVMSSYYWQESSTVNTNDSYGPPTVSGGPGSSGATLSVYVDADNIPDNCAGSYTWGKWACEHRRTATANMVAFRKATAGQAVNNWQTVSADHIAFGLGSKGFVAINRTGSPAAAAGKLDRAAATTYQTALPAGAYCDIIHYDFIKATGKCVVPGTTTEAAANDLIVVDSSGRIVDRALAAMDAFAIYVGAGPLAVNLASFTAEATANGVTLAWETVSETDNAGFNVDRADSESGPWVRLNAALIPAAAPGSSQGHVYTWIDPTAQPNTGYVYRLEAVALDGTVEVLDTLGVTYRPAQRRWLPMAR